MNVGGVVSTTVTVCAQLAVKPLQSVTIQVRVMFFGQLPLVIVLRIINVLFVPQQALVVCGSSKLKGVLHWTVLLGGQMIVPGGHGLFVGVVTLKARLKGTPWRSFKVFHAAGNGALPQTAVSL